MILLYISLCRITCPIMFPLLLSFSFFTPHFSNSFKSFQFPLANNGKFPTWSAFYQLYEIIHETYHLSRTSYVNIKSPYYANLSRSPCLRLKIWFCGYGAVDWRPSYKSSTFDRRIKFVFVFLSNLRSDGRRF